MKAFLILLVALLVGCAPAKTPLSKTQAVADLAAKTVALVGFDDEGSARAYCSGVWVGADVILTAEHCTEGLENGFGLYVVREDVYDPDSSEEKPLIAPRPLALETADAEHDLALLRVLDEPPSHGTAALAAPPSQGAPVQTMGHSRGLWFSYSSGDVAAVRKVEIGLDIVWIQATAPISPGNSGCGLFDERGQLVGIASRALTRGQALNFFVPAGYAVPLLRGAQ